MVSSPNSYGRLKQISKQTNKLGPHPRSYKLMSQFGGFSGGLCVRRCIVLRVCTGMCVQRHTCVCTYGDQRSNLDVIFQALSPFCLGQSSLVWSLTNRLGWLPGTACLCTPSPVWDYKCGPPYYVFCMKSRGEIQVPMLAQPAQSHPNSSQSSPFKRWFI